MSTLRSSAAEKAMPGTFNPVQQDEPQVVSGCGGKHPKPIVRLGVIQYAPHCHRTLSCTLCTPLPPVRRFALSD